VLAMDGDIIIDADSSRNKILSRSDLFVVELPFPVHPEIPAKVSYRTPSGEMYERTAGMRSTRS
jgi:hypothetical protein